MTNMTQASATEKKGGWRFTQIQNLWYAATALCFCINYFITVSFL
ncbi:Uncharacterised protein [Salmonella enterica subsp. enterica]|uniref:Uncharacterized protein n=1 Tax=Salmonella enterica I TaxID=59201 RepID=A0A447MYH4_SALET|nr:Uncharacterised protein [Salmonella enterica subsp. enterica]